jgi:hypothetical protein
MVFVLGNGNHTLLLCGFALFFAYTACKMLF